MVVAPANSPFRERFSVPAITADGALKKFM